MITSLKQSCVCFSRQRQEPNSVCAEGTDFWSNFRRGRESWWGLGVSALYCSVTSVQFNSKNFNHPTRGNFVVAMAGS